jgi:nicotinate dehydrogenase subunit B
VSKPLQPDGLSKRDLLCRPGILAVVRGGKGSAETADIDPERLEPFVIVAASGTITAFNGHVDLGTGIRTALTQIVAEELDVGFERVTMVLGDTAVVPDQGATIASETIQISAVPLRRAAAQARQFLVARAAETFGVAADALQVDDGIIRFKEQDNRTLSYGDVIGDRRILLALDDTTTVKPVAAYKIVGRSQPRVDLPAKATGGLVYVHDMRVPGMLHGRVVRPPYAGVDSGDFVGASLISVDRNSIAHIPGIVLIVTLGDFIGIVAEREEQAEAAMRDLKVAWRPTPELPPLDDLSKALRNNPSRPRRLLDTGDVDRALSHAAKRITRNYVWPYHLHGSIGPSCALADYSEGGLRLWSGTQNPIPLRADLALLLDLPKTAIDIIRMEAAGCYGRNCADDVCADAALLSRAVGRPVRVQLTRDQEHMWEPKGAAQLMEVDGGLDAAGGVAAYDFSTRYPSNTAPTLALLLTGKVPAIPVDSEMGDRTAVGPYDFDNKRITVHDMAPILRASWLRGVSALPNTFAHESYIDELAAEADVDPIDYRLSYLKDPRAVELIRQLADRAGWKPRPAHSGDRDRNQDKDGILHGRGFAYALYVHSKFPGYAAAWSAWVADVAVNTNSGEVALTKITVGQDSGLMINPDGVKHQIHGNVIQSTSRVLKEQVTFSDYAVTSREWGAYPLLTFPELPPIDVLMVPRPNDEPLGVGESASVPSAAAIANAIFDATGVRFREPPFTPERILAGLRAAGVSPQPETPTLPPVAATKAAKPGSRIWPIIAAALGAFGSIGVATLPFRSAIAPIARPEPNLYSAETIERGRQLAHLGACFTCHMAEVGAALAGGRAIETPFGHVFATNITPDPETGIGSWSYTAFERAMREGLHRDGRHLYSAFPYTSFAKTTDADLQALYAFLMAQPAVRQDVPKAELAFPFNQRALMAAWNTMFHRAEAFVADPSRSAQWNRGAYLVEGLGHCSACHTPRNALGAEESGGAHLAGGVIEGWAAPALTAASRAPIAWSEGAFYDYLRTGFSPLHGAAAGPMAPVIAELKHLPDEDIRAMAHYLASFNDAAPGDAEAATLAADLDRRALERAKTLATMPVYAAASRMFDGACGVCHEPGRGPVLFGVEPSLALNSAVHADAPDTLIRVIIEGINLPELGELGAMPPFGNHFDDAQIAELTRYVRARFAADAPPWTDLDKVIVRVRADQSQH